MRSDSITMPIFLLRQCSLAVCCCAVMGGLVADEPSRLIHRWELEPALGATWEYKHEVNPLALRPERLSADIQSIRLSEAQLILRGAIHGQRTMANPSLPALLEQLKSPISNRSLRLTMAAAAIAVATAEHAEQLWQLLGGEPETRPLIERALIDWARPLPLELWRERLQDPSSSLRDLLLAIEGVGIGGSSQDQAALEALLRNDRYPVAVKLITARALARVAPSGLEKLAQETFQSNCEQAALLAATLLSQHTSQPASELLQTLLDTDDAAAQRVAYAAAAEHFPAMAQARAVVMLEHPNNNIRRTAVEVLNRVETEDGVRQQAIALADRNRRIRNQARANLQTKAEQPELRGVVEEVVAAQLRAEQFQAVEQALLLAVALEKAEHCPRMLELLKHPRMEVSMTAAWALQELATAPEIARGITSFAEAVTQRLATSSGVTFDEILRQAYLLEALGRMEYRPAVEMLKIYIPKDGHKMGDVARASAIWSLGKIFKGSRDAELAKPLAQRMLDASELDPEDDLVKYTSTVALGWIGAPASQTQVESLEAFLPNPLGLARQWSLQQFANPPQPTPQ